MRSIKGLSGKEVDTLFIALNFLISFHQEKLFRKDMDSRELWKTCEKMNKILDYPFGPKGRDSWRKK